jgi:hypothetical protein
MPPTAPSTVAETFVAALYLLNVADRIRKHDDAHPGAVYLTRSWLNQEWMTLRDRLAVRRVLGYRKTSQTFGPARFGEALATVSDIADDGACAATRLRYRANGHDVVAVRLSLDPDDWEDLLASLTDPETGETFSDLLGHDLDADDFLARALTLGFPSDPVPFGPRLPLLPEDLETDEDEDEDQDDEPDEDAPRKCSRCQEVKPPEAFSPSAHRCRPCSTAYDRERLSDPAVRMARADANDVIRARLAGRSRAQVREARPDEKPCPGGGCRGQIRRASWFAEDLTRPDCLSYFCTACAYRRRVNATR